eukprot:757889-Hanusia_phi.AAC.4
MAVPRQPSPQSDGEQVDRQEDDRAMTETSEEEQASDAEMECLPETSLQGPESTGHPDIFKVVWRVPEFNRRSGKVHSPLFEIAGIPWSILMFPIGVNKQYTSLFLDSKFMKGRKDPYRVNACFEFTVENRDPALSEIKQAQHVFQYDDADWGFHTFLRHSTVIDPSFGYLVQNVLTVILVVRVLKDHESREYNSSKDPILWLHDPRVETGFVGLKNQGATCYMNSLLQSLFHIPALQRAVYKMPTEQETANKRPRHSTHPAIVSRNDNSNSSADSVALALQRVFYNLQHSKKSVGTKALTKSFGWDALDAFTQHDVQELDRVLCDNLEEKMKGTIVDGEVPRLFRGKLQNFVKCINVDFSSVREEEFYDLSLNVKGCKNIEESLMKYVEVEKLDGENKYMADGHGLQDAEKGCAFLSLPPVLHLHLKRFEYDPVRDANVKINDKFEFGPVLDLSQYMEGKAKSSLSYLLHSVLVHSGDVHGGHYFAYIRPDCKSKWLKFNDERVSVVSAEEAIQNNFGGEDEFDGESAFSPSANRGKSSSRRTSNAYMLVYVRESAVAEVLRPLTHEEIPDHLRQRFRLEEEEEELRRKEKLEAHLKMQIRLCTCQDISLHQGLDLVEWTSVVQMSILKTETLGQLKHTIGQVTKIPLENLRVWLCRSRNDSMRVECQINSNGDAELIADNEFFGSDTCLFCENTAIFESRNLGSDGTDGKLDIVFFKAFNAEKEELISLGHFFVGQKMIVSSMIEQVIARAVPEWKGCEVEAFDEDRKSGAVRLESERELMATPLCTGSIVVLSKGDVCVCSKSNVLDPYMECDQGCIRKYYDKLLNSVTVRFRSLSDRTKDSFQVKVHLRDSYDKVCDTIVKMLNMEENRTAETLAKEFHIQLYRHNSSSDGPEQKPAQRNDRVTLEHLLSSWDKNILYFQELSFDIRELESKHLLRVCLLGDAREEFLVDKDKNLVVSILECIKKRKLDLSPEIYICHVGKGKIIDVFDAENEENEDDIFRLGQAEGKSLYAISVSAAAGGVKNASKAKGSFLLRVSHFEFDKVTLSLHAASLWV